MGIHRVIEARATARPHARAVVFGAEALSYAVLEERANRLAHHLVRRGVRPDSIVGVELERSFELVIAMLAVMKAGGAYLPLDPNYPADRRAFMLDDCKATIVINDRFLAQAARDIANEPATAPDVAVSPENLAYIIYTSGSTGKPKGVMIPHDRVLRLMSATDAWFHFDERDVWTFFHSYAFDFSVWEIWGALTTGGSVVIVPESARRAPEELLDLLVRDRVTVLNQIPSSFRHLIAAATRTSERPSLALRYVIFGGEALELRSLVPWFERYPQQPQLVNMYGITETTVHVTYRVIDPAECANPKGSPIGVPIPDLEMHLLDEHLRLVASGDVGEIYVGGAGLARGYHARPSLTAERFIPDPFSGRAGDRLYKTGDLARRLPDGSFEYLGRNDHQVKIRGYRIETGEIASVLATHPAVREAAVVARDVDDGDRRLVGYVALNTNVALDVLRDHVAAALPSYMVPSAFVVVDRLPLTPSGKIDTKALPAPDWSAKATTADAEAPRTDEQQTIAKLWCEVLKIDQVGLADDFFELGGHSLLAIRLVAKLRGAFGVELTLGEFFAAPTVAGIAALVTKQRGGSTEAAIPKANRAELIPASSAQERVWFVERMLRADGPRPLNVSVAIGMRGDLDPAVLARAASEVIARHEIWRTNLRLVDKRLAQVIGDSYRVELPVVSEGALTGAARDERLLAMAREQARAPFDLANGRVVRWQLLRFAPDDHVLLVCVHHAMYDGASIGVLVGELAALYDAFRAGQPSPLSPLPVQYADIAAWQRSQASSAQVDKELAYWTSQLAGVPIVDLPTDRPRPTTFDLDGSQLNVRLPRSLSAAAREFAQREGVSMFVTLLAAFSAQLSRRTGLDDIVIGTAVSGRNRPELESTLGLLLNMLAIRVDTSGDPTFRELVQRVKAVVVDALAHQDAPFEKVAQAVKRKQDAHRGLVQVVLTVNTLPGELPSPPGQTWRVDLPDTGAVLDDIALELVDDGTDIFGAFAFRTNLFDRATIEGYLAELETVLQRGIAAPDQPLSEQRRRPVHAQIRDRALATPSAVALVYGDTSLTYAELVRRAHQLANALQARGVGPDTRVALCLERSLDLVVAMLGVLEAGGAYIPLDPNYPADRLQYMLDDAQPVLVLTQERVRGSVPTTGVPVVVLDTDAAVRAARADEPPAVSVALENLAYVIYTSGSTGKPKGTLVQHGGLENLVANEREIFDLGPASRVLQFASVSFDASVWETFATLVAGGTLVLASPNELLAGKELVDTLRRHAITLATLPPSVLAVLRDTNLPALRTIVSAGEAVSSAVGERWAEGRRFINAYGPTESTVCATYADVVPGGRITIGRALRGISVHVLDERLRPVAAGGSGELYIGGAGLARGYHARPGLTGEKFVPDPFSSQPGARMYRTGDHVKLLDDGNLEFIGRLDDQVKIRGFRIELGEVEAALHAHPAVRHAVCAARGASLSEMRLVGYVIPASTPFDGAAVLEVLARTLPAHMVPSTLVVMDAFPMTPAGKVHRDALEAPHAEVAAPAVAESVASRVAALFAEVLEVPSVGVDDNFFEIGGHSLLAAHAVARIGEVFGVDLPLRTIFDSPTASELALALPATTPGGEASPVLGAVMKLFAELLEVPSVEPDDNFFERGGHSILAAHLVGRLEEQFGVEVPLRDVFDAPTPRELAARVENPGTT